MLTTIGNLGPAAYWIAYGGYLVSWQHLCKSLFLWCKKSTISKLVYSSWFIWTKRTSWSTEIFEWNCSNLGSTANAKGTSQRKFCVSWQFQTICSWLCTNQKCKVRKEKKRKIQDTNKNVYFYVSTSFFWFLRDYTFSKEKMQMSHNGERIAFFWRYSPYLLLLEESKKEDKESCLR